MNNTTFDVYSISTKDKKYHYYGSTKDFKGRMKVHEQRFKKNVEGYHYKIYTILRKEVKSLKDCNIKILKTFDNKEDALIYEQKMINKNGNLNHNRATNII